MAVAAVHGSERRRGEEAVTVQGRGRSCRRGRSRPEVGLGSERRGGTAPTGGGASPPRTTSA